MKKKTPVLLLLFPPMLIAVTFTIYWFNLDNKIIYYGVRPLLNRLYDRQHRDIRL